MKQLKRKSLLYKTAVEYGDYTINHVEGCSHGCMYPCYAMLMAKRFGKVKSYDDWIKPKQDHKAFYNKLSGQVIKFCKINNREYHIKEGTMTGSQQRAKSISANTLFNDRKLVDMAVT